MLDGARSECYLSLLVDCPIKTKTAIFISLKLLQFMFLWNHFIPCILTYLVSMVTLAGVDSSRHKAQAASVWRTRLCGDSSQSCRHNSSGEVNISILFIGSGQDGQYLVRQFIGWKGSFLQYISTIRTTLRLLITS